MLFVVDLVLYVGLSVVDELFFLLKMLSSQEVGQQYNTYSTSLRKLRKRG
jgi:hypothetical protein